MPLLMPASLYLPQVSLPTVLIVFAFLYPLIVSAWSIIRKLRSPLRKLRGPSPFSLLREVGVGATRERREAAMEKYGDTFVFTGWMGQSILVTFDPRALNHVLTNNYMYPKPQTLQRSLGMIFGEGGLLVAEGEKHKRQRRVMNPSFSPGQIRDVTPIFFEKSIELRDILQRIDGVSSSNGAVVDVFRWVSRATLDIIGLAGFDHSINSLSDDNNELATAFRDLFARLQGFSIFDVLRTLFPILRHVPVSSNRAIQRSMGTMQRVALELVRNKKEVAMRSLDGKRDGKEVDKSNIAGRDLLSSLVRANMAADVPVSQRLTDEEVSAQISTFLLAGHETTSSAVTWALYALAKAQDVQTKLREELISVVEDTPSMDDLNALPYLDMFVREVMRFHAPVLGTSRVAERDDVIPVSTPYLDNDGVTRDSIRVHAGDRIAIPIKKVNTNKFYWGPDALEFKPERWQDLPAAANGLPGIWSHLLTFISGPRACIGYRFSLVETKALLFTLVRAFAFDVDDPSTEIISKEAIVSRPFVKGKEVQGAQLPLRVTAIQKAQ